VFGILNLQPYPDLEAEKNIKTLEITSKCFFGSDVGEQRGGGYGQ
jgi:hypothetical protein